MSNPLVSFSLDKFLVELPEKLQQPMFVAVTASVLAHGLFFLALPTLTSSATAKKGAERVVNVIELTPEEQAKLPQTIMMEHLPTPNASEAFPPLANLIPGMAPQPSATPLPSNSLNSPTPSLDDLLKEFNNNQPRVSFAPPSEPLFEPAPLPQQVFPKPAPPQPVERAVPKPAPEKPQGATPDQAKQPVEPTSSSPPTSQSPTQQPAAKARSLSAPDGQAAPVQPQASPSPPQLSREEQNQLLLAAARQRLAEREAIVARTYSVPGTTNTDRQGEVTTKMIPQLSEALGTSIADLFQAYKNRRTQKFPEQPIPPEWQIDFKGKRQDQPYTTVIETYIREDGSLAFLPQVTQKAGVPLLDTRAMQIVKDFLKSQPNLGRSNFVEFTVPFLPPQPAEA